MRKTRIFLTIGALLCPALASAQDSGWVRYAVPDSGARVDMPAGIFSVDAGAPESGFGRRFTTPDGRAKLAVQSIPNDGNASPAAFLAAMKPPANVVYRRVTPRFFVLSSIRDGNIWYNRCNASKQSGGRFMNCVLINYPAGEKRQWDGVVTRISRTLASS